MPAFQQVVLHEMLLPHLDGAGDVVPGPRVADGPAQRVLFGRLAGQQRGVLQPGQHADDSLAPVLRTGQRAPGAACILQAALAVRRQDHFPPHGPGLRKGIELVAVEPQVIERAQPIGPPGVPRDKDQLAVARPLPAPLQEVRHAESL